MSIAWKTLILSRYLGEFQPAEECEHETAILKSSEDICYDLQGMGTFQAEEVSAELALRSYKIIIDEENKPKWLMKKECMKMIK